MANITQTCNKCGKQFLIIDTEQQFLQGKNLPMPTQCPNCRQERRLALRGERKLYRTTCQKCGKEIIISYDPKSVTSTILCKEDYEKHFLENDQIIKDPLPE
ncbi:zinc-ribbon domain containing protein [Candidatus Daviesbacteria bacterium]|nr:zinc-ribbon domain containing protein [Candidatus Daviesbacteria bacterium]